MKQPFPLSPYFQRCWGPLAFFLPLVGMGIQSSNLKRIFWSRCDSQPSHLEVILGPDEEIANITQRRQEIPSRLLRFFFFFLVQVELQETDLTQFLFNFDFGSQGNCTLVQSCWTLVSGLRIGGPNFSLFVLKCSGLGQDLKLGGSNDLLVRGLPVSIPLPLLLAAWEHVYLKMVRRINSAGPYGSR